MEMLKALQPLLKANSQKRFNHSAPVVLSAAHCSLRMHSRDSRPVSYPQNVGWSNDFQLATQLQL